LAPERIFDRPHYQHLNEARVDVLQKCLDEWKSQLKLATAWDIGCGVGRFSTLLMELGFQTRALDGREENAMEAGRRNPGLDIHVVDVEDPALASMGATDLVLCLGLLYHLENPFRTVRSLHQLTGKILVVESVCTYDEKPNLLLVHEKLHEDQGLRHVAFYPSETCLVKMLYLVGFPNVFRFTQFPDHPDFQSLNGGSKVRTMLAATKAEFSSLHLTPVPEPFAGFEPWVSAPADPRHLGGKIRRFAAKPWPEKAATLRRFLGFQREA
jgi:SAM-dependent methyltransferase